jgi:translocation and assembly module TamB
LGVSDTIATVTHPRPGKPLWLRGAGWCLALLLLLAVVLALVVGSTIGTERGQHWLLSHVPGLKVTDPIGAVLGGSFQAKTVTLQAGTRTLTLHAPKWHDLQWQWRPRPGAWLGVQVQGLYAQRVEVSAPAQASTEPLAPPRTLRLPVDVKLSEAVIDELLIAGAPPLRQLQASLSLGEGQGALHRIERATLQTDAVQIAVFGTIATDPPFATTAQAQLSSLPSSSTPAPTPWQGQLQAQGPLEALTVKADLGSARAAGASLQAQGQVTPFAAWPLGALDLKLADLDLHSLAPQAPKTRLSGEAHINTRGRNEPIRARIALTNAQAGRWSDGALPLAQLKLEAQGSASDRNTLDLPHFELLLADSAGQVRGSGRWQGHEARLALQLEGIRPAALDARAAALSAGGKAQLTLAGLPSPEGKASATALRVQGELDLQGQLDAPPRQAVRLKTQADVQRDLTPDKTTPVTTWRIALKDLALQSAGASAQGELKALLNQRNGNTAQWSVQTEGQLANFEPAAWWKDGAAVPPAVLNGRWQADLRRDGATRTQGQATLTLANSLVGQVPTSGELNLQSRDGGWAVDAKLQAADNKVQATGTLTPNPASDRWQARIEAPSLASLSPLARSLPAQVLPVAAREHLPTAGSLNATVEMQGRWPQLRSSGELKLQGFISPRAQVQQLQAQWQAGPDVQAPLRIDAQAQGLAVGEARAETLALKAEGTVASHQLSLTADTPIKPPAALQYLSASNANSQGSGSRFSVTSQGRLDAVARRWQSTNQLNANARSAGNPAWFAAQDVTLAAQFDAKGKLTAVQASEGKSQLGGPGGAQLLWKQALWTPDTGAARGELKLDVELQPLAATPLLNRLYPQAGIGGDLAVKGRVIIQASDTFAAEVVLERDRGDLFVRDEGQTQTQSLGLTDLRMGYAANDGTWHFTQAIAGTNLGVLVGATSMRLPTSARWPAPTTPMEGVLEWQVADMGIWARFMPPGWRLGGQLRTSAAIGGRFGAPEVRGQMEGKGLALRNLLQGVDVRDGELLLSLNGAQAKVERFVFKGGDGELRLTGGATLGAKPSAQLNLVADKFRMLGRIDRRIVASGQAELGLAADQLSLNGKLALDEGLIDLSRGDAPTLDSDVKVRRTATATPTAQTDEEPELRDAPTTARRPSGAPRQLSLALAVDLGNDLKLRGRGLDTRLAGQLNLTAPGGRMAVNGTVRAVDGTYAAYGQKLDIERGVLSFTGTVENPRLDIFAVRPNLDVRVGVQVAGTAQAPRVRLSSEPEMSEFDKLSWLVLGRAGDGLGRPDTALLQRAALALLSGPDADASGSPLSALGLDDFSVRQTSEGDVRNTVVSLGKQLSRRWYLGYERGVNSTTGTWQLIYRAAQRFTLRAQSGEENALDAIWTWRWN